MGLQQAILWAGRSNNIHETLAGWHKARRVVVSKKVARCHLTYVKRFIFAAQIARPDHLTRLVVQDYIASIAGKLAPGTLAVVRAAITSWGGYLADAGLLATNPLRKIVIPKTPKLPPAYLTEGQAENVQAFANYLGIGFEVRVALLTGLRVSELRLLTFEIIDLDRRLIQIVGKGQKWRCVPICDSLHSVLEILKARKSGLVWPGNGGGPQALNTWWKKLAPLTAVFPEVSGWHIFRHTFASRLAQRGCSIAKISKFLGHRSIQVTLDYYANLAADNFDDSINLVSGGVVKHTI